MALLNQFPQNMFLGEIRKISIFLVLNATYLELYVRKVDVLGMKFQDS